MTDDMRQTALNEFDTFERLEITEVSHRRNRSRIEFGNAWF